jgi:hypothetical protein
VIRVLKNFLQESPTSVCATFPSVPVWGFQGLRGDLNFGEIPTVCGGEKNGYHFQDCWSFKGGSWKQTYSTLWPSLFYAMSKSPFKNASQSLFIAGGSGGPDKSQVIKF